MASRIQFHFEDEPENHSVKLDGYPWEDVAAVSLVYGPGDFVSAPTMLMTVYTDEPFRVIGNCRVMTGLPPDKLIRLDLTTGNLHVDPRRQKQDGFIPEKPAVFINGEPIRFRNVRVWVTGGQQVYISVDRVTNLPNAGDPQEIQTLSMFLVRGKAGTDLPPLSPPTMTKQALDALDINRISKQKKENLSDGNEP